MNFFISYQGDWFEHFVNHPQTLFFPMDTWHQQQLPNAIVLMIIHSQSRKYPRHCIIYCIPFQNHKI